MSHSSIFLHLLTHPVPPWIFHIHPQSEFYSLRLCHKGTSVHLLAPPLDSRYNSFFSARSRSPARNRVVHWAVQIRLHPDFYSWTPRKYRTVPPPWPCFLELRVAFTSRTSVLYPPNFCCGQQYFFLTSSYILPYFVDFAIPPHSSSAFCYLLPYSPSRCGWQPLFWHLPCFILPLQLFSILQLFRVGTFPVLLLILY